MAYSTDFRQGALDYIKEGHSHVEAAKVFDVGVRTLFTWKKKLRHAQNSNRRSTIFIGRFSFSDAPLFISNATFSQIPISTLRGSRCHAHKRRTSAAQITNLHLKAQRKHVKRRSFCARTRILSIINTYLCRKAAVYTP